MPVSESCEPRMMLPPPTTTASCRPGLVTALIMSAIWCVSSASIPCPPSLQKASPEILRRIFFHGPCGAAALGIFCEADAGAADAFVGGTVTVVSLPQLAADEPGDLELAAEGLAVVGE